MLHDGLVMAKKQDLGVDVVHRCFSGRGDFYSTESSLGSTL